MKRLFVLLSHAVVFTVSYAQHAVTPVFNEYEKIEVTGKINQYKPGEKNQFATFRTYSISGCSKDTSVAIDNNGNFRVQLFQPFAGDIAFMYNDGYITLYSSPSEKISITIDDATWSADNNKIHSISIQGKSAVITKSIIDFQYLLDKKEFKNQPDWQAKDQPDEKLSLASLAHMREAISFLKDYIRERKLDNKIFEQWSKNDITYATAKDIAFKCFARKINKEITHAQLIKFLHEIPLNNTSALQNSAYYEFMKLLSTDFEIIVNVNTGFKEEIKLNGQNYLPVYLKQVDLYATDFAKQLMYYNIYMMAQPGKLWHAEYFTPVIKDSCLLQLMEKKKETSANIYKPYNLIQRIKEYKANDSLKVRLIKILEEEKGHFVFIDFWGSWCAPCMMEMPTYPSFIEKFKTKPVSFIFFAVDTKEEKIEETKKKYRINGKFVSLTGNETKILNNVLSFSSYPAHFVVNPSGEVVVDSQISHIGSNGNLSKTVVDRLNTLLLQ